MSSSSESFSGSSSSASCSRSDGENSFDVEELLQIGIRRTELRKEKDMLRESQPHSIELVRRLERHTKSLTKSHLEDKARIQKMEKELLNCYKEIDYLRDQLIFKSKEVNYLSEQLQDLESKLAESRSMEEEVDSLKKELCISKSEQVLLLQELESKETELHCSFLSVERLEETISSLTLDSFCEIESMKLDITALEHSLFDAMKIQEESIREKDQLRGIIEELQLQSEESEKQNEELRKRFTAFEMGIKEFLESTKERLESENEEPLNAKCFFTEFIHVLPVSKKVCEYFDAIIKKLELSRNVNLIDQQQDLVKQLKDELKQEKLKAKEEAEELTQEMAELRYNMTCLLDEERNRRVCIEQASLQRIAELESQIKRKTNKPSPTDILHLSGS